MGGFPPRDGISVTRERARGREEMEEEENEEEEREREKNSSRDVNNFYRERDCVHMHARK